MTATIACKMICEEVDLEINFNLSLSIYKRSSSKLKNRYRLKTIKKATSWMGILILTN
jgi:ribosomal protein L31E